MAVMAVNNSIKWDRASDCKGASGCRYQQISSVQEVIGCKVLAWYRDFLPYPKQKFERTDIWGPECWSLKNMLTKW